MDKLNNVILFPTLRRSLEDLEEESYDLIEEEAYEEALENIDELLAHQYTSFDINVNKLHCLTELGRLKEAEEFSEDLLIDEEDEDYYDYLGYYIMILYELNNFNALMTTISDEEKKGEIPAPFAKKFKDIYRLCYQMNMVKANDILNDFESAVIDEDHSKQWYYLQKWIALNVEPTDVILNSLHHVKVHPVIKTRLLEVFMERNVDRTFHIEKFGFQIKVNNDQLIPIKQQAVYVEALNELAYLEQENPTLYSLIEKLLYQYHYVRYPFLQDETDVTRLAEALVFVAERNFSNDLELKDELIEEIDLIEVSSQLYLNLINE